MNGLLVVDKPVGPTSHDLVARVRRALGERRVGHTGTLDPEASGVLPLVLGRATRLARFLSGQDKTYEATVRLGIETDSYDGAGTTVAPPHHGPWPDHDAIERALDGLRGTYAQQPPAYSAKKIGGERSYRLARRAAASPGPHSFSGAGAPPPARTDADPSSRLSTASPRDGRGRSPFAVPVPPALPAPVIVTVRRLQLLEVKDDLVRLHIECSAGFYVRSLAHDLGQALGIGAHLAVLARIASGRLHLADAIRLDAIEADPEAGRAAVLPLARMLPELPARRLTHDGVRRAVHGQDLRPVDLEGPAASDGAARFVRLMSADGDLVAVGEPSATAGLLHPLVVLM